MNEKRKLAEAEFFYARMQKEVSGYDAFVFYFSAFLTAARSALQYMNIEVKSKPGGQRWYDNQISGRPVLRFFKDMRDANIHIQPLGLSKSVTIYDTASFVFAEPLIAEQFNGQGVVVERPISKSGQEFFQVGGLPSQTEYRYTLQEWSGPEDILSLSRTYLDEVIRLVADGIAQGYITG